jgi:alkylation response protein AidB-like acyl-CoA dehydrogenase
MVAWLNDNGRGDDPVVRERLAALELRVMEAEILGLKVLEAMIKGRNAAVDAAMNKIVHTLACQEIARAVLDLGGPEALVGGARPELLWRQTITETIGGGTSEIMRSVIARQLLGLGS